jgi:hypothetical protein
MADMLGASGRTPSSPGFDADGRPLPAAGAAVGAAGLLELARRRRSDRPPTAPPSPPEGIAGAAVEPDGNRDAAVDVNRNHDGDGDGDEIAPVDRRPLDRRALLTRLGVASAVAWSAPTILSMPAAAAATDPTGPCFGCQAPALVNPDAETGNLTGWTGLSAGVQTWLSTNTVPPLGAGLHCFVIYGPTGSLAQTVGVPPACTTGAHTYGLGFVYSAAFTATALTAQIEFFQGATSLQLDSVTLPSTPNPNPPPAPGFVTAPGAVAGTIPNGADSATIRFLATAFDAVVDRVTLTFC